MTRCCARDGCANPAREEKGGKDWQKLCSAHIRQKAERRVKSRAQPKCRCGNCLPLGGSECRGCQAKREQREGDFIQNAENLRRYYDFGVTP